MNSYKEIFDNSEILNNFYFLVIALLLAFGTLQLAGTTLSTDKPVVSVVSCSMYPQYDVGDILFVQGKEFHEIKEEDVVVYDVWNEVNITVAGTKYEIKASKENRQPSITTEIGELNLLEVTSGFESQPTTATIQIEDQRYRLRKGQSITHNGQTVKADAITGIEIPIVHRVIDKQEDYLQTKGDNNEQQLDFEKKVRADQIHGTVLAKIPWLGNIKIYAMDLVGLTGGQPFQFDSSPQCQQRV